MPNPPVSAAQLRKLIELRDGVMFWRERGRKDFDPRFAGKPVALRTERREGYKFFRLARRHVLAHRAIWALRHGAWPSGQIDHINGVRDDNRMENLRVCTPVVNGRNKARQHNNSSGRAGVVRCGNKWRAQIVINDKYRHIGVFPTFAEAVEARAQVEAEHGFTARHGVEEMAATRKVTGGGDAASGSGLTRTNGSHSHDGSGL